MNTATLYVVRIISEFTFLFWLDDSEHINDQRIDFGEIFEEEIKSLNTDLKNLWNRNYYSPYFENTLRISSDSLKYIVGLDNNVIISNQGQTGSTSFNQTKSMT